MMPSGKSTPVRMNPIRVYEVFGATRHFGGVDATSKLLGLYPIKHGSVILEIGCGTGYTACLLAKKYGADVTAIDKSEVFLKKARERAARAGLRGKIRFMTANAERLPLGSESFDIVIAESVLSLCDASAASAEAFRVLKHGGAFLDNEVTYLRLPPPSLRNYFRRSLGIDITLLTSMGWKSLFFRAGFRKVTSKALGLNMFADFSSHIKVYGLAGLIRNSLALLGNSQFRKEYLSPDVLRKWSMMPKYTGYGLYVCIKY